VQGYPSSSCPSAPTLPTPAFDGDQIRNHRQHLQRQQLRAIAEEDYTEDSLSPRPVLDMHIALHWGADVLVGMGGSVALNGRVDAIVV
jgi:hypothetical protein